MRVWLALGVSIAVHTGAISGALAWVYMHPTTKPEPKRLVTITLEPPGQIVPVDAPPMVVALLDDHTVASPGPGASPARNTRPGARSVVTAATTRVETPPPIETQEPPPRNSLLKMRHDTIEKGPSDAFMKRFLDRSPPIIDQSVTGVTERLHNPNWIANATPDEVAYERAKLVQKHEEAANTELKPNGAGTKSDHETFKIKVAADGTVDRIADKKNWNWKSPLSATFDVSDMMMRGQGIDPYASYKLKVLDETRDQRVATGKRYRTQQLARSREHMQKNLDRLLANAHDVAALKHGLFELWDDCAETGSDELIAGGRAAREQLIGFVRSRLPVDGDTAFSPTELAQLNKQRKSHAIFAPYE